MSAPEKLNNLQFSYDLYDTGGKPLHRVQAFAGPTGANVGSMLWSAKSVRGIGVPADQQRRGVATAMWQEGHRLASENQRIPMPRHSTQRTTAGDAWAKSVGGRLPRRDRS